MKEALFIRSNLNKWQQIELLLDSLSTASPDVLADSYAEVTSDLAFAQTNYPDSRITSYLNNLAVELHTKIYRNRREPLSRCVTFWTKEVPDVMWKERKLLLLSLSIFVASMLIGIISTLGDSEFPRVILGDSYMDMTLRNIEEGKPMDVYGRDTEVSMFIDITLNNVMVSFIEFASGILTSFFSGFAIFSNGIMVGSFLTFFFQHGLLIESFFTTMMHGVIELSSIIVAGAAGLAMGNGWLFPGTYPRMTSFVRGARRGLKIIVGTIPLFIIAGFIESFLTRHTEINNFIRGGIILSSLAFVIFYFIYLPYKRNNHTQQHG